MPPVPTLPADPSDSWLYLEWGKMADPAAEADAKAALAAPGVRPYDKPGRYPEELFDARGPLDPDERAIAAFAERTGVRRAIATLVPDGLPRRANHGTPPGRPGTPRSPGLRLDLR